MDPSCLRALREAHSDSDESTHAGEYTQELESAMKADSPSSRTHRGGQGHRGRCRTRSDVRQVLNFMEGAEVQEEEDEAASPTSPSEAPSIVPRTDLDPRMLPVGLVVSLILSATCWLCIQCPLVSARGMGPVYLLRCGVVAHFLLAFGLMAFTGAVDPGMVPEELPDRPIERSYKSSQFPRRIRRYDHYCRWLLNGIGLHNHREFFMLLMVFTVMVAGGSIVDVWLLAAFRSLEHWATASLLAAHLVYLAIFGYNLIPVVRLHVTFVSRNELANEWKEDENYVVDDLETGTSVWVGDLDTDEFNAKFDSFRYDPTRNRWDKGCPTNCFLFWFVPRWDKDQTGEF